MAEQLGQAVLELTVDTKALEKGLDDARKKIAALTGDVNIGVKTQGADAPQQALKNISTQAERAATRVQTLNQVLNQIPGNSYAKLSASISKLTSESRDLQLTSEQYLKTLTRIRELEGIRQLKVGRQQALAGEAAYGPSGALGQLNQAQLPQLPLTLEGQAQNIRELQQRLRNLNYESAEYAETLRVLQNAQRQYDQALSGTSDTYRQLAQQEEAAIRRAEKLKGIQEYYADKNPRAGGIRDDNGSMLARGANSAADERAYNAALRPSQSLLENDLKRVQALRQVTQRLQEQAALVDQISGKQSASSFGAASASNFGATDPVQKSIRRNQEKVAKQASAKQAVLDAFDDDLARVREQRVRAEKTALDIAKADAADAAALRKSTQQRGESLRRRAGDAVGSGLIGGAFPALFGQGAAASLGGGVGGVVGGAIGGQFGFGLSLIGTAVGQRFDEISKALEDPIKNLDALKTAGLLSSKAIEQNVEALIKQGRTAEAAATVQLDLVRLGSTTDSAKLRDATVQLNRAFSEATLVLGQFVAGPLAEFLRRLRERSDTQGSNSLENRQRLTNNSDAMTNAGTALAGAGLVAAGTGFGLPISLGLLGAGGILALTGAATRPKPPDPSGTQGNMDREFAAILKLRQAQEEYNRLIATQGKLRSANYKLIDAEIQGNKEAEFSERERVIRQERLAKLEQGKQDKQNTEFFRDVESETAIRLYRLQQERAAFERQQYAERIAAANRLRDIEEQIGIAQERAAGNLTGAGIGALQTAAGLEAAKRREQDAQAQLRARPADEGLQNAAREAAKQTQLAAANARADLIEASKAAELSVRNIAQSLQDAVLAQQQLVGTNQGLTNILGGQAAVNRQKEVNAQLQQDVRGTKAEYIRSLGPNADPAVVNAINRKEFSGTLGDQNRQMIQFIEAARQEMRGAQGIDDIQKQLVKAQNDLVTINGKLYEVNQQVVTAVSKLAEKNWVVNVNVPGGSASGDVVGAINSRT